MKRRSTRRQFLETAGSAIVLSTIPDRDRIASDEPTTGQQDPAYQSGRRSLCQQTPPPGKPLSARKSDTGIQLSDNRAGRIITYIADASKLKGGDLTLCSEYGRIEIMDSDDKVTLLGNHEDTNVTPVLQNGSEMRQKGKGYESKPIRVEVTATSALSNVTVLGFE